MGFRGEVLKWVLENYIIRSETGSGFGEIGDTPPAKIPNTVEHIINSQKLLFF